MRISDWSSDVCSSDLFRLAEAIAEHRFTPAKAEQKPCRLHIALCGLQENFLVIAFQEAHGPGRFGKVGGPLYDARRIGTPVDKIAKQDDLQLGSSAFHAVDVNEFKQLIETVQPPMNVEIGRASCGEHGRPN